MQVLLYFLLTLHILTCLLIVLVVLMQRPRSEGLGAAFGGGMTENIFGAQTTHVLAKFTTWLGGIFFLLTLALAMVYARINSNETAIQRQLLEAPAPVETSATPAPTAAPEPAPQAAEPASGESAPSNPEPGTVAPTDPIVQPAAPEAPAASTDSEAPAWEPVPAENN
jgi:protein translocase, SecG subunit